MDATEGLSSFGRYGKSKKLPKPKFTSFQVTLLTTAVDKRINRNFFVIPGMGNFGDRYYGTESIGYSVHPSSADLSNHAIVSEDED